MSVGKPEVPPVGISSLNIDQAEASGGYLGVFERPPVDTLLQKSNVVEILPVNPVQRDAPLDFQLGPWHDRFLDTSSIRLYGQVRLRKILDNGTETNTDAATDDISCISSFPLGLFKSKLL